MSIPHLGLMRDIQLYIDERIRYHTAPYTSGDKINLNSGNVIGVLPSQNGGTGTGLGVGGHVIQQAGANVYQRGKLNFIGVGVTVTDNTGTSATDVTVSAISFNIQNRGTDVASRAKLNFLGPYLTATDNPGTSATDISVVSSAHVIESNGTPVAARPNLNFKGTGVVVTDNGPNAATDVTIAAGAVPHATTHETPTSSDYLDPTLYIIDGMAHHVNAPLSSLLDEGFSRLDSLEHDTTNGFGIGGFGRGGFGGTGVSGGGSGGSGPNDIVPVRIETVAYTLTSTDHTVVGDTSTAPFALTLPPASSVTGKCYEIIKGNTTANDLSVVPSGSDSISGMSSIALSSQYDAYMLRSIGTCWCII